MAIYVNLMSEKAQFHAAARRVALRWAAGLAAVALALTPIGVYEWQRRRAAIAEQETLEAQYEPIRQLTLDIRRLRNEAHELVRDERVALELARERPPTTMLALVGAAAAASDGELYLRRLTLTHSPVAKAEETAAETGRLALEASSAVSYDVERFVKALGEPPLGEVKVLSTETAAETGGSRKRYGIEASF